MWRKPKRRPASERVRAAKKNGCHVEFDYDETSDVLAATLAEFVQDAEDACERVARVTDTLSSIIPPAVSS